VSFRFCEKHGNALSQSIEHANALNEEDHQRFNEPVSLPQFCSESYEVFKSKHVPIACREHYRCITPPCTRDKQSAAVIQVCIYESTPWTLSHKHNRTNSAAAERQLLTCPPQYSTQRLGPTLSASCMTRTPMNYYAAAVGNFKELTLPCNPHCSLEVVAGACLDNLYKMKLNAQAHSLDQPSSAAEVKPSLAFETSTIQWPQAMTGQSSEHHLQTGGLSENAGIQESGRHYSSAVARPRCRRSSKRIATEI
jgi:hypothetical protein